MMTMLAGTGLLASPSQAAGGGGEDGAPALVPMEEIAVPILDGARLEGILRFTLVLRAHDDAAAADITRQIVRLRSAALVAGLDFARMRASPYRAVDVAQLAMALDAALKKAEPGVEQALIVRVGAAAK
ncbi:MAG: hypothetical protein KDE67_04885 [Sphingobium sp.]|nr:hypothetical protein [Sphingobium sp.]MCP5398535.1 hypothetical protein [Sphingomonas sp.]